MGGGVVEASKQQATEMILPCGGCDIGHYKITPTTPMTLNPLVALWESALSQDVLKTEASSPVLDRNHPGPSYLNSYEAFVEENNRSGVSQMLPHSSSQGISIRPQCQFRPLLPK